MKRTENGFTLVELMMVVLIITLLIFMLIPAVNGVMKTVKIHQTQGLVNLLDLGVEQYKLVYGSYPPWSPDLALAQVNTNAFPNSLDGWKWGLDPAWPNEAPFILTYCLQGPAGMGWKTNRDGKLTTDVAPHVSSVTADFGPWVEAGNSSIQQCLSGGAGNTTLYRPAFVDSFGTAIMYYAPIKVAPNGQTMPLALPQATGAPGTTYYLLSWQYQARYSNRFAVATLDDNCGRGGNALVTGMYASQVVTNIPSLQGASAPSADNVIGYMFYAALMNQSYNWTSNTWVGTTGNGQCYHPNTFIVWSAGPDTLFGFWYYDDTMGSYVADLTFNPMNFDDITNFR